MIGFQSVMNKLRACCVALGVIVCVTQTLAATGRTLTVSVENWPQSINPTDTLSNEGHFVATQVYETLTKIYPDGEVGPELAKRWKVASDRRSITFWLRDARFSDGTPVTTEHVKLMLTRVIRNGIFFQADHIKGAVEFRSGKAAELSGLEIQSPQVFILRLNVPYARLLQELADVRCALYHEVGSRLYGSGPFVIVSVDHQMQSIVLKANPVRSTGQFERVTIIVGVAESADISFLRPPNEAAYYSVNYFNTQVIFLGFNAASLQFRELATRQLYSNLMSAEMVDDSLGKVSYTIGGYLPLGLRGYDPYSGVDESGVSSFTQNRKVSSSKVTIWVSYPPLSDLARKYCAVIESYGTRCQTENGSLRDLVNEKKAGRLQLFLVRLKPTIPSADDLLSVFDDRSVLNLFTDRSVNGEIVNKLDSYYADIVATQPGEATGLYKAMDRFIIHNALVRPLRYGDTSSVRVRKQIAIPPLDTLGILDLDLARVSARH